MPTWFVTSNDGRECAEMRWPTGSWTSPPNATALRGTSPGRSSAPATARWVHDCNRSLKPGDRIAILCPQNLNYLVVVLRNPVRRTDRGAAVRPVRAGPRRPAARRARRLRAGGGADHQRLRRRRAQVLPQPPGQRAAARHRRRRRAQRGGIHLGAARGRTTSTPSRTCSTRPARPASPPAWRSPT